MRRRPLIKHTSKIDPTYEVLSTMVSSSERKGLRSVIQTLHSPTLRFIVTAFRHDLQAMPKELYSAIRENPDKFEKVISDYFDSPAYIIPLSMYKYWVGYNTGQVTTIEAVADKYLGSITNTRRKLDKIGNEVLSHKFLSKALDVMCNTQHVVNTTNYEQVKEFLDKYSVTNKKIKFQKAQDEKTRIMLLLYRNHANEFTESEYYRMVKGNTARDTMLLQINEYVPEKYIEPMKEYIGIGCEPQRPVDLTKKFDINKTMFDRKVNKLLSKLAPQLVLS